MCAYKYLLIRFTGGIAELIETMTILTTNTIAVNGHTFSNLLLHCIKKDVLRCYGVKGRQGATLMKCGAMKRSISHVPYNRSNGRRLCHCGDRPHAGGDFA